jgi:hypothetical protein
MQKQTQNKEQDRCMNVHSQTDTVAQQQLIMWALLRTPRSLCILHAKLIDEYKNRRVLKMREAIMWLVCTVQCTCFNPFDVNWFSHVTMHQGHSIASLS